jgi:hypothetical protein
MKYVFVFATLLILGACTTVRTVVQDGVSVQTVEDRSLYGPAVKIVRIDAAGKEPIIFAAQGPDIITSVIPAAIGAATGIIIANGAKCTVSCGDQVLISNAVATAQSRVRIRDASP